MLMYFVRHTGSNEVEMIDLKTNKKFLKRCPYPSLLLKDLYVGGTVTIFSRQLQVVAFSDPFTQRTLGARQIKCLAVVSASALQYTGLAITEAQKEGINVEAIRMVHLNGRDADEVAAGRPDLINAFRDTVVVMQLVGSDTPNVWSKVISRLPGGNEAFFGSINASDGDREVKLMFGPNARGSETATYDNCTLCVIKPHIVRDGKAGEVITAINEAGFQISAIKSFTLNLVEAEEFLEIYKGVLPEFNVRLSLFHTS
jgi:nucleoside-diphosphate kinase